MIRWIVESSLRLRFLIIVLAAVLLVFGINQLGSMPVDVFPEFNPPIVEVQTEALGLSAAEVESLITLPMEADLLNGVAWLERLYSESVAGLSSIHLIFEPGTDLIRARQMVQERLTQAFALPNVSKPPTMLQPLSTSNRVLMVSLSSQDLSLIDLSVLARWTIKPRLSGLAGVANVAIWGQRERQLQVQVDPAKLHEKGLTLDQIIETTGEALWVSPLSYLEASSPGTAGWIDTANQRLTIRHLSPIVSAEQLAKVSIVDSNGVLLGDVTNVVEDHQPLIGDAMLNSGDGLLMVVEKFPGADTLDVTQRVEAALENLRPGLQGVVIDTSIFRPANYIEQAMGNLSNTLMIGGILALLLLLLLLFDLRLAFTSVASITLSMVAAAYVLYWRGATSLNIMVLAGFMIALGVVVDDAIADVSNIANRLRANRKAGGTQSSLEVILESVMETRSALFFATLIILLAVLPLFFLDGMAGSFFQPLVVSYLWALIASLLVALIITPTLTLLFLNKGTPRQSPVAQGLQRAYQAMLRGTVRAATPLLAVAVVLALIGGGMLPFMQRSLLPSMRQNDLLIEWNGVPGASREAMQRTISRVTQDLKAVAGVHNVGAHIGRAITGDQIVGINGGEIWVQIDMEADYDDTVNSIEDVLNQHPGFSSHVQAYQPARLQEAILGAAQDLTVRVYGHDPPMLREKAAEVEKLMAGISGVVGAKAEPIIDEPQVEIEVKLDKAEQYQIKPGDVRRQASSLLSGIQVGNLYDEQKIFDVIVWGVPELRTSLDNIQNLLLDIPNGKQVRLADVADVRVVPSSTIIKRDTVSRFVDVTANVNGRSLAAVTAEIQAQLKTLEFPLEYHAEVVEESIAWQAARQRILGVILAALLGIFLILHAVSGSWRMAFVTLITLPMALAGGILAAMLTGGLTLGAIFGLFAVFGIAVRNTITSLKHFQTLEESGQEAFGADLVVRGAGERFTPILLTALTTAVILAPFVFLGNIAGHELVRPMAIVVLGGLVTSLFLTLFVIPALYLRFGFVPEEERLNLSMLSAPAGQAAD